jgi:regulator of sirC expression with transglutaminase-like and TPR domain
LEIEPVRLFAEMMKLRNEEISLARAALLIARTEYPALDMAAQLARLDELAAGVCAPQEISPLANVDALNDLLFTREKFAGNEQEYDDPKNSYLNDVLTRKLGIPITLSLIYMEVAKRRNIPLAGVSFPGHFLVKYTTDMGELIIDPYHRGAILTPADCAQVLQAHFGAESQLQPHYFDTVTTKQILVRMLNNLKGSYSRRKNYAKVLTMIEMTLSIDPGSIQDIRDRGMVHLVMKRYREAMADFKLYLSISPEGDPQVKEVLQALRQLQAMLN